MRIGVSTFCLLQKLRTGEMTPLDVIDWIADSGAEYVEVVPFGFELWENDELLEAIVSRAAARGIPILSYCIPADFLTISERAFEAEVDRVKQHVDIARRLGAKWMRHDVCPLSRSRSLIDEESFELDFLRIREACRLIADYAKPFGITTTVENHGLLINGGDCVGRLVREVERQNFRCTLDIGNFLLIDEPPLVGMQALLPYMGLVHFKDFYIRRKSFTVGSGSGSTHYGGGKWFVTADNCALRGAIIGHGDMDVIGAARLIVGSGYDGCITVEFEGIEDCLVGTRIGLDNLRRYIRGL